ncbi:Uncharacterized protein TCM_044680 [Theobroma cacao]|uniref:Transposase MuDR plant domain-containing protein n=1 Tax=Theobroma cacao TaxID=3641 RepID=A0A061FRK5_THECC|nr:Uncharacterized protein TCM_044680 [Theobroma cacao]
MANILYDLMVHHNREVMATGTVGYLHYFTALYIKGGANEIHLYLNLILAIPLYTMDFRKCFASVNVRLDAAGGVSASDVNVNVGVVIGRGNGRGRGPSSPIDVDVSHKSSATSRDTDTGDLSSEDLDWMFETKNVQERSQSQGNFKDDIQKGRVINKSFKEIHYAPDENGKVVLVENMLFNSVYHFMEMMADYMVQEGIKLYRAKNEKTRFKAFCQGNGYEWMIHAALCLDRKIFKTKKVGNEHTCFKVENDAYKWLMEKPLTRWARHTLDPSVMTGHVTNNMAKSFNNWIRIPCKHPVACINQRRIEEGNLGKGHLDLVVLRERALSGAFSTKSLVIIKGHVLGFLWDIIERSSSKTLKSASRIASGSTSRITRAPSTSVQGRPINTTTTLGHGGVAGEHGGGGAAVATKEHGGAAQTAKSTSFTKRPSSVVAFARHATPTSSIMNFVNALFESGTEGT